MFIYVQSQTSWTNDANFIVFSISEVDRVEWFYSYGVQNTERKEAKQHHFPPHIKIWAFEAEDFNWIFLQVKMKEDARWELKNKSFDFASNKKSFWLISDTTSSSSCSSFLRRRPLTSSSSCNSVLTEGSYFFDPFSKDQTIESMGLGRRAVTCSASLY